MVYSGDLCFFNIFFSYSYLSACMDYIVNIWNDIIRIIIRLRLMGKVLVSIYKHLQLFITKLISLILVYRMYTYRQNNNGIRLHLPDQVNWTSQALIFLWILNFRKYINKLIHFLLLLIKFTRSALKQNIRNTKSYTSYIQITFNIFFLNL